MTTMESNWKSVAKTTGNSKYLETKQYTSK